MAVTLSNRARCVQASPTLAVASRAKQMAASGIDVVNFGVGEPDFNTPQYVKQAAHQAIDNNFTHYTPTPGIIELRQAICQKLKDENGLDYTPEQVLVSAGAKASILTILLAVCNPRDEVIVPAPYWVSYPDQVQLADAVPVIVPTTAANNYRLDAELLEQTLQNCHNPKVLILNSPNNPTGSVYTKDELTAIARVCLKYNIVIISDEIYEKLIYEGEHVSIAGLSPEIAENTVVINGVSKAYAMTGWRLGYAAGPKDIITYAGRIQGHFTSNVCSISQKAALAALTQDDGSIEKMRQVFATRRDLMCNLLDEIPGVSHVRPSGAFYVLADVSACINNNNMGITNSTELCLYLLENKHVALVAGSAFGIENHVRFSYASSEENIKKGLQRFKDGLSQITG